MKYQISGFFGDILKQIRAKISQAKEIATIIPKRIGQNITFPTKMELNLGKWLELCIKSGSF